MQRLRITFVIILAGLVLFCVSLIAQEKAQYIGAAKCKMCHMTKKQGEQYSKWEASPHAKAYATLATEEAKAVAKKIGVTADPQKAPECLVCHVTGYSAPAAAKAESYKMDEGVGCEACHGPGSLYKTMKVMKDLRAGKQDAKAVSFIKGDKATCLTCHNEKSPTYKPFKFEERWAVIAHPIPSTAN